MLAETNMHTSTAHIAGLTSYTQRVTPAFPHSALSSAHLHKWELNPVWHRMYPYGNNGRQRVSNNISSAILVWAACSKSGANTRNTDCHFVLPLKYFWWYAFSIPSNADDASHITLLHKYCWSKVTTKTSASVIYLLATVTGWEFSGYVCSRHG